MYYDVNSPRYSHLKGLTPEQITLVMIIADGAIAQAKREFEKERENQKGLPHAEPTGKLAQP